MEKARTYLLIGAALWGLLALTVLAHFSHLGPFSLVVSLAIAIAKAGLVAAVFMHLRRGDAIARLFAATGLFWLVLLMGLTLSDFLTREPEPAPVDVLSRGQIKPDDDHGIGILADRAIDDVAHSSHPVSS